MKNNVFTTKILDIIASKQTDKLSYVFLVMEHVDQDLKKVFNSTKSIEFNEDHVLTILYNTLCAINFVHSANLMHRDIKPANILVDVDCQVKLCDFGLSRTVPEELLIPKIGAQQSKMGVNNRMLINGKSKRSSNLSIDNSIGSN